MTENKMGVMPVGKLIFTMSLPMILSMLIQALYNVVDSVFVSWINEESLTAVSMAFPIQNLMIAVAVGTGVGVNALLSRSLGEKNYDIANRAAENAVFLAVISCLVFTVLGTLTARVFFAVQSTDPQIVEYGTLYLRICSLGCVGIFIEITMERLLQATGRTFYTMITQGVGAVINIVLDPILIFGLGPFPQMGIAGAAVATVTGQIVAGILAVFFNAACNHDIHLSLRGFRPDGHIILRIYSVGIPSIVMNSIGSVMTFGLNQIVGAFTATATAVLGIYFKFQSFVFMPIFGLNNGMVPIVAYNYGARKKERMVQAIRLCIIAAVLIMLAGLLVIQFFSAQILMLFKASENMLAIGVPALKIICISFLFAGFNVIVSSTLQALGHGFLSMVISIIRQLVVLLPAAYLLSLSGNLTLIWWSFPIAELVAFLLCIFYLRHLYQRVIQPLEAEN
ncbi:MATE family efflux transporter [Pseudoflavonifractor sp. MCC625]|uniref:MATE family efflux transporter n=1 Tax=Pseudoflavonifractor sp. MCC625 TaxID=2592647 RepID=UPI001C020BF5|nr:MATE family efflux transporter [Pseudoflavonifractor sp. MCC625]MBT9685694.1 MATE family efflux transporter [Pseudoflavonifractor sp. MCC625]